ILMVLVNANAVEAELVGKHELVEIAVVELVPVCGVVERVGKPGPRRFVFRAKISREAVPGHEVESEAVHGLLGAKRERGIEMERRLPSLALRACVEA